MHLTDKKSAIRYLDDSRILVFLAQIRNAISHKNKTARAITDTRLCPNVSLKENLDRQIAPGELGRGEALKDFLGFTDMVADGATTHSIQQLKGIMSRQPIDCKRGTVDDRILKSLGYGRQQMQAAKIKTEAVRQSLKYFTRQQKEEEERVAKHNYIRKQKWNYSSSQRIAIAA